MLNYADCTTEIKLKENSKTNSVSSRHKLFYFSRRTRREIKHWNGSAAGAVHMQDCMYETAETFHGCFNVFVLVFYFPTAEIKRCFI